MTEPSYGRSLATLASASLGLSLVMCVGERPKALPFDEPGADDGGLAEGAADARADTIVNGCDTARDPKDAPCLVSDHFGVFVDAQASADGDGTRAKPLRSIGAALLNAKGDRSRVFVCGEKAYAESVTLGPPGADLYGGFDCAGWSYSGKRAVIEPTDAASVALLVDHVTTPVRVQDFEVRGHTDTGAGATSVGAFLRGSVGVELARVTVVAGAGSAGAAAPVTLTNFFPGIMVGENATSSSIGGSTKTCLCIDGSTSTGGAGGLGEIELGQYQGDDGAPGTASPANAQWTQPDIDNGGTDGTDCISGGEGHMGASGASGVGGVAASAPGTIGEAGWQGTAGGAGTNGTPGQGGGGGAANSSPQKKLSPPDGGGGGACGGCGGAGGEGGGAGGSSIAIVVLDTPLAIREGVRLVSAAAGNGGMGGSAMDGQVGGIVGGNGTVDGCAGGAGGHGGRGGAGAGGSGGVSVGIAFKGVAPSGALDATEIVLGAAGAGGPTGVGGLGGAVGTSGVQARTLKVD